MVEESFMTKEERVEYNKKWYQANKEKVAEYYQAHKDEILERQKKYNQSHKNELAEYNKRWCQANIDKRLEQQKLINKRFYQKIKGTPIGRARILLGGYKQSDKLANRGNGDLTAEWIVENIFTKPCAHCGISGWEVIGCNRLDNDKPHTKDNVEPCCALCNSKLPKKIKL